MRLCGAPHMRLKHAPSEREGLRPHAAPGALKSPALRAKPRAAAPRPSRRRGRRLIGPWFVAPAPVHTHIRRFGGPKPSPPARVQKKPMCLVPCAVPHESSPPGTLLSRRAARCAGSTPAARRAAGLCLSDPPFAALGWPPALPCVCPHPARGLPPRSTLFPPAGGRLRPSTTRAAAPNTTPPGARRPVPTFALVPAASSHPGRLGSSKHHLNPMSNWEIGPIEGGIQCCHVHVRYGARC